MTGRCSRWAAKHSWVSSRYPRASPLTLTLTLVLALAVTLTPTLIIALVLIFIFTLTGNPTHILTLSYFCSHSYLYSLFLFCFYDCNSCCVVLCCVVVLLGVQREYVELHIPHWQPGHWSRCKSIRIAQVGYLPHLVTAFLSYGRIHSTILSFEPSYLNSPSIILLVWFVPFFFTLTCPLLESILAYLSSSYLPSLLFYLHTIIPPSLPPSFFPCLPLTWFRKASVPTISLSHTWIFVRLALPPPYPIVSINALNLFNRQFYSDYSVPSLFHTIILQFCHSFILPFFHFIYLSSIPLFFHCLGCLRFPRR